MIFRTFPLLNHSSSHSFAMFALPDLHNFIRKSNINVIKELFNNLSDLIKNSACCHIGIYIGNSDFVEGILPQIPGAQRGFSNPRWARGSGENPRNKIRILHIFFLILHSINSEMVNQLHINKSQKNVFGVLTSLNPTFSS